MTTASEIPAVPNAVPNAAPNAAPNGNLIGARGHIYRLIAEVFERLPDADLVTAFRTAEFSAATRAFGYDFGLAELPDSPVEAALQLRIEFTRLFVGPGPSIARFGSLYDEDQKKKDGGLWADSTAEVDCFMKAVGMPAPKGRIPDHIGIEMAFMSRLVASQSAALSRDDTKAAKAWLGVQQKFLRDVLSPWVPKLCKRVIVNAQLPFYAAAARLTQDFLTQEAELSEASA